jgi:hypothetical protein
MQSEQADEGALAQRVKDAVEALRIAKRQEAVLEALRQLRQFLSAGQYPPVRESISTLKAAVQRTTHSSSSKPSVAWATEDKNNVLEVRHTLGWVVIGLH